MNQPPFSQVICWKSARVSQVINKDAISIDLPNFMATHMPLTHIRCIKSPQAMDSTSEDGLLQELLSCERHDHHGFMVIRGIPGTGKSHLIRWLKERYQAETSEGRRNHILLIERSNNSLLGTLQQIINTAEFNLPHMQEQLNKLRSATETLSQKGREEMLISNLHIATSEVSLSVDQRPKSRISKNIGHFLLDPMIREWLIAGPIHRISDALVQGSPASAQVSSEFLAQDFQVDTRFLTMLRQQEGGYPETRRLAELLLEESVREDLALYLNRLLGFAISRTTALSADDLRQMFNSLRRSLHQQGHTLTLFIEDITSFTGVDTGLIDVIVTQHTGKEQQEFCRLVSVVGITDSYYEERFPDNLRDRITHLLTLNTKTPTSSEASLLLDDPQMIAGLAARYLNAMRVDSHELTQWYTHGSRLADLPNACVSCQFRTPCHGAFGAISLEVDTPEHAVGLYPFNAQALKTMYDQLDPIQVARTPRALLNSILLYVLQSHGPKITQRAFPPPAQQLGVEFKAPTLAQPAHLRIIKDQAGSTADRVETLLLFWGNRTAYSENSLHGRIVGEVDETIFHAFSLPTIDGVGGQAFSSTIQSLPPTPTLRTTPSNESAVDHPLPTPLPSISPPQPMESKESKYITAITNWQRGQKLQYYEDLRGWLVTFIKSAIDWEAYGVSSVQQTERLAVRRFAIEDQVGRTQGEVFRFNRSDRLVYVLQALAMIRGSTNPDHDPALATHLVNLQLWLRTEVTAIVEFVQGYRCDHDDTRSLLHWTIAHKLWLDCLCGRLIVTESSSKELFLRLIHNAVLPHPQALNGLGRTETLRRFLRGLTQRLEPINRLFLQQINLSQGGSDKVLFVDAARAIDILRRLQANDWNLPVTPVLIQNAENDPFFNALLWADTQLSNHLGPILHEERRQIQDAIKRVNEFLGNSSFKEIAPEIQQYLDLLTTNQITYDSSFSELTKHAESRSRAMKFLETTIAQERTNDYARYLSASIPSLERVQEFLDQGAKFLLYLQRRELLLDTEIANTMETEHQKIQHDAYAAYDSIEQTLQHIAIDASGATS